MTRAWPAAIVVLFAIAFAVLRPSGGRLVPPEPPAPMPDAKLRSSELPGWTEEIELVLKPWKDPGGR